MEETQVDKRGCMADEKQRWKVGEDVARHAGHVSGTAWGGSPALDNCHWSRTMNKTHRFIFATKTGELRETRTE